MNPESSASAQLSSNFSSEGPKFKWPSCSTSHSVSINWMTLSRGIQPNPTCRLTVAFDLEDVLVSSTIFPPAEPSQRVDYATEEDCFTFYVILREGVEEFLKKIAPVADLVILTTAAPTYAEALLQILDPTRTIFTRRIYRPECHQVADSYVKNLGALGLPVTRTLVVQYLTKAGCVQPQQVLTTHHWGRAELQDLAEFILEVSDEQFLSYPIQQYQQRQLHKRCSRVGQY